MLAGTANLARVGPDFTMSLGPVLEALEEHVVLLKLLGTVAEQGGSIAVRIGHENPYAGLQTTSMVTTGYGAGSDLVAGLGVRRPDPHGLPHDDGLRARRRDLRLADPRRVGRPPPARATPARPDRHRLRRTCHL